MTLTLALPLALPIRREPIARGRAWLVLGLLWLGLGAAAAQVPGGAAAQVPAAAPLLRGLYRVAASTDGFFPVDGGQEWFLDFGRGTEPSSGRLALTLRQNPNLRVRLLVWQFTPERATLRIGRESARQPGHALAPTSWQLTRGTAGSLVLRRAEGQTTLVPATPSD